MMNDIFAVEIAQGWLSIYMDDLIIANEGDHEDLVKKAKIVFNKLEEHNLLLEPEKCEFFKTDVSFLRFRFKDGKLAIEEHKVSGILDWPAPTNVSQIWIFIGFCNYYQ